MTTAPRKPRLPGGVGNKNAAKPADAPRAVLLSVSMPAPMRQHVVNSGGSKYVQRLIKQDMETVNALARPAVLPPPAPPQSADPPLHQ